MKITKKEILKNTNILYIEDEKNIRENVKKTLLLLVNEVFDAKDIEMANKILFEKKIDIIISDINLPTKNGIEFVKELREKDKKIPVILLSAHTDTNYLLEATKLRLVDYLKKPISFSLLQDSLLNAVEILIENSLYSVSFSQVIHYNVFLKKLFNNSTNEEITLTQKELKLLDYLIINKHRVISSEEIKNNIWEDYYEATDSALKNLLNKLRKKIGKESISNISGVGYRINL